MKEKVEIMLSEYRDCWNQIRHFTGAADRALTLGATVISSLLFFGVKEKVLEIYFLMPIATGIVFFYWFYLTAEILTMGGYRKSIETKINEEIGESVLIWESIVVSNLLKSSSLCMLRIMYALFYFSVASFSSYKVWIEGDKITFWSLVSVWTVITFLALFCVWDLFMRFDRAYGFLLKIPPKRALIGNP